MNDDDLKVCPRCGWYEHSKYRPGECRPALGKYVDEVIAALPNGVEATKLGYGTHNYAVKTNDVTLVFNASEDRTSRLDRVFGASDLRTENIVALSLVFMKLVQS